MGWVGGGGVERVNERSDTSSGGSSTHTAGGRKGVEMAGPAYPAIPRRQPEESADGWSYEGVDDEWGLKHAAHGAVPSSTGRSKFRTPPSFRRIYLCAALE